MRLFLRCLSFILCAAVIFNFLGCASVTQPKEVISAMLETELELLSGRVYSLSEEKGSDGYLSDEMLLSLYGFDRGLSGLVGGAVCLSSFYAPFELAVFLCDSTACTEDVALCFKNRLTVLYNNAVTSSAFCEMTAEEYRAYINGAAVVISGRYVALIISSDTEAVRRAFLSAT